MRKNILALLVLVFASITLMALPVDQTAAKKTASNFAHASLAAVSKTESLELVKATDAYYVFNIGDEGFVIISSDDRFRPVIGYSEQGAFPVENPSPEMMYYLDNLSQGRKSALRAGIQQDPAVAQEWKSLLEGDRMPVRNDLRKSFFLMQTRWNQDYPYNKYCPSDANGRAYAGCVATAMSQVMNYWKCPTHGYGRHSYVSSYGELSVDFSAAEYDFDNMPLFVSNMSPDEESDEIALFMYHCGVSVDMMYSASGSGAYSEDVPDAVLKYFGYTNRCRVIYRDSYSLEEFQALLKDQFDLGWPCYYSGTDTGDGGGHAFVCDGYDENDLFHFNWGWSGSGDGFYAIDELNVSSYAFNSGQSFIANFVPAEVFPNTAKAPSYLTAIPNGDDEFSVTLSWTNPTSTLDGQVLDSLDQIVLMRDGSVIQTFEHPSPGEAMTFVDPAGLPIMVNYTVHAVYQGFDGRKAHADDINLGPVCNWTVNLTADQETGWGDGMLSILNSSGVAVAELSASRGEMESFPIEVPLGRVSFHWTAPVDSLGIGVGMEVLDAMGQTVFAYEGPSALMPEGLFFEYSNTCDTTEIIETPSELTAEVTDNDVVLQWQGVSVPGYGYVVYRDDYFYAMVSDPSFTDEGTAQDLHRYYVTAFLPEGETEPSNTVSAVASTGWDTPYDLDYEILDNSKVKLTWSAPQQTDQLVGYQVYRGSMDTEFKRIKSCGANVNSYTDNFRVDDGNRYYYMVIAAYEQDDGYVLSSAAPSLHHPDQQYVVVNRTHIPSALSLTEQEDGQLLLQWDAPMLAETYNLYRNGEQIANGIAEAQYACAADGEPAFYQVTGVLNGVESSPSNKAFYANYGVEESETNGVSVFPIPTQGVVNIVAEDLLEVTVFSAAGQQVLSRKASGKAICLDLSDKVSGLYFVKVRTNHGTQIKKVVLVK